MEAAGYPSVAFSATFRLSPDNPFAAGRGYLSVTNAAIVTPGSASGQGARVDAYDRLGSDGGASLTSCTR